MTVTLALGQIVSGRLSDKFKPTNMILYGLLLATAVNLLFPLLPFSVPLMTVLWGINGFAHSMIWPPMVRILVAANDGDDMYGYSVVRISFGASVATILLYLIAPLIISVSGSWRGIFPVSILLALTTILLWLLLQKRIPYSFSEQKEEAAEKSTDNRKFRIPKAALFPLVLILLGILIHGMLRDSFATWMPTYLVENYGLSNEISIFYGIIPAIFQIISYAAYGAIYRRWFKNEVLCAAAIFGTSAGVALLLLLLYGKSNALVATLCITTISGCMHGVNLMLITHVPKRFKRYGNVSTFAGIVNACTYAGDAISTYGISLLATRFSWYVCLAVCLGLAACGTVCCLLATRPWEKFAVHDTEK